MLKAWKELTESRRGWAIGGIFGLLVSTLYFSFYGHIRGQFFFHLLTAPGIPGILLAENFAAAFLEHFGEGLFATVRFLTALIATTTNYFFWGCYCSFLYKIPLSDPKTFAFSLFVFFVSVMGVAYSFSRGITYEEPTAGLTLLLVSFLLALIAFTGIFSYLIGMFEQPKP